jgi:hypothetical protein
MKFRYLIRLAIILPVLFFLTDNSSAQMSSEFWITAQTDSHSLCCSPIKLIFGNHVSGTYGLDSLNPILKERCYMDGPPFFNASWVGLPNRGRCTTNSGPVLYIDIRGIPTNPAQSDTFIISFYDMNYCADFTFRWPLSSYLTERCDSMFLVDVTGQIPRTNMFDVDSLVIQDVLEKNIYKLHIYKYGCNIIDIVDEEKRIIPTAFTLEQNRPNPFNPSTQINFTILNSSHIELKVYDIMGREISTLVNERKQPGNYTIRWNARNTPCGVYYYRLLAGNIVQTKKMVLMK